MYCSVQYTFQHQVRVRYPLPGERNPTVSLTVLELRGEEGVGQSWTLVQPTELGTG